MRVSPLRSIGMIATILLASATGSLAFDFSKLEQAVTEHHLKNGLTLLVMENHDAPVVSCITYANVGGVDDPKEYTGLAHMFEHMAFKGTTTLGTTDIKAETRAMAAEDSAWAQLRAERKKGQFADSTRLATLQTAFNDAIENARQYVIANAFDQILESEGAEGINAGTSEDQTIYEMSLPSNKIELWMDMESERFLNPVLREMYKERDVIAEERRETLENNPIMRAIDVMQSTAFSAHPYGISIVGHMSDIQNFSRAAAEAYFKKYYVPSNMIIAVVGDVQPAEVIRLAEKYWSRIPYSPPPEPLATIEPPQQGEKTVSLEDPAQPMIGIAWHVPSGTSPDWPALQALTDRLGQGRTSLLYTDLAKEKKIAANVGVYLGWPANKYPCLMFAYAMPAPGHSNDECETEILTQVDRIRNELIPSEEVEKIRARAKASFINRLDNNLGLAMALADYQNNWGDWRQLFKELDRINAVTAQDIQRVAQTYLTDKNRTVAKLNTIKG